MSSDDIDICDCLVIGGGPAGLTAAIYLARFHLSVIVADAGGSRARLIPRTHNHAGFPGGIAGTELVERMREQARLFGAALHDDTIVSLAGDAGRFRAQGAYTPIDARTVLLATGVVNRRPPMMDDAEHDLALAEGLLRYCPICDGYEVTDRRVAVLGTGDHGCNEATFLRSYTPEITLVAPAGGHELTGGQHDALAEAGIRVIGECRAIERNGDLIAVDTESGRELFDTLYPALGSIVRSELAAQVGVELSGEGCLLVDAHQRTSVAGLYAAGDVVLGLDQISHAMGEGGVAATTIRNDLAKLAPLRR